MRQIALVSTCTATLAIVGYYMGFTVHGPSLRTFICALAGGAGGFGIGCCGLDIFRRWQAASKRTPNSAEEKSSPSA